MKSPITVVTVGHNPGLSDKYLIDSEEERTSVRSEDGRACVCAGIPHQLAAPASSHLRRPLRVPRLPCQETY